LPKAEISGVVCFPRQRERRGLSVPRVWDWKSRIQLMRVLEKGGGTDEKKKEAQMIGLAQQRGKQVR